MGSEQTNALFQKLFKAWIGLALLNVILLLLPTQDKVKPDAEAFRSLVNQSICLNQEIQPLTDKNTPFTVTMVRAPLMGSLMNSQSSLLNAHVAVVVFYFEDELANSPPEVVYQDYTSKRSNLKPLRGPPLVART